ncbi:hypothetical protein [Negadavirga shengliensis]|uniref:Uncharacterized protein n=1 Tax=Negadavirga shengliensis TaxID=1389218 RepID=A0ABV9T8N9_9BACT
MRTSLLEIKALETHLLKSGSPQDRLVMNARLLLSHDLRIDLAAQKASYELIQKYGRRQLREEIKAVENEVFHSGNHPKFMERIRRIFGLNL